MPYADVLRNIAANGLSARDAARVVDITPDHMRTLIHEHGLSSIFENSYRLSDISVRFKEPAWDVIARLADSGKSRNEVALEVGYNPTRFQQMLKDRPDRDPFPSWEVAGPYLRDTGETVVAAARRLAADGLTEHAAGRLIGYACGAGLAHALKARGVVVEFQRVQPPKPKLPKERKWVETGGPKTGHWRAHHARECKLWADKNERV